MSDLESLFQKNLSEFRSRHEIVSARDLTGLLAALTETEREALATALVERRWLFRGTLLHSTRDPEREARRAADGFASAKALIAISMGAGYLLEQISGVDACLIIEAEPYLLAAFILAGRFKEFRGKITLFTDALDRADALEEILPWLQGRNLKQVHIYMHAPYLAINKSNATRAFERVKALFEKRAVNQATIIKFQQLWNKNIFLNSRVIAESGSMDEILNLAPPQTVVLAGAGPSLTESLSVLASERRKFILFAADTALVPLNRAGIYPDFVFSADPQWLNHYFCQSEGASQSTWVMDPVVCPAIPREVRRRGGKVLFWNNVFLADQMLRPRDRGDVQHGGSVSTNAFDVAVKWLGSATDSLPRSLILVGQDLSFSNRQAHAAGAVLEAQIFTRSTRIHTMEAHNLKQMREMPVMKIKKKKKKSVRTNGKLRIFHEWFEARASERPRDKIRYINATHDGAFLAGFEHMQFEAFLKNLPELAPQEVVAEPQGHVSLQRLYQELGIVLSIGEENGRLTRKPSQTQAELNRLNENDSKLKNLKLGKDIAGLNAQAIILKITEQGDAPNASEFYLSLARAARELRHWLSKVMEPTSYE